MSELPTGVVTFLFTDIEGSTLLWERYPERMREALTLHDGCLREVLERHHGLVFHTAGDGMGVAFSRAQDAVTGALAGQVALDVLSWPEDARLRVRMGIHTGEADERHGDYFGPPLNRAARVMAVANGGQVVVSGATAPLVESMSGVDFVEFGSFTLRGIPEPIAIFGASSAAWPWRDTPLAVAPSTTIRLPNPMTELVGRVSDLERIVSELYDHHLVTLIGTGGVGKTRLALEVGWASTGAFPDGVAFVDLATVGDTDGVAAAFMTSVDARLQERRNPIETLIDVLRDGRRLLVVDNCEHVLDEVASLLGRVFQECRQIAVLATSREPLALAGELVVPVTSLDPGGAGLELFLTRARDADGAFSPSDADLTAAREVCKRLDGIPLAIELAAARVRSLSVSELADRLDDRFRLLGGGRGGMERHQTLRATVSWSYQLLNEAEQLLFDRLAVFVGSFDIAAVEAVCEHGELARADVLTLLVGLVDKSMVVANRSGRVARYSLLETLRQFGDERLAERGESTTVRDAHVAHYRSIAVRAADQYAAKDWDSGRATFLTEWDNLRGTFKWSLAQSDLASAAQISVTATQFASDAMRAEHAEWVREMLSAVETHAGYVEVWEAAAGWAEISGDHEGAIVLAEQGIARAAVPTDPSTAGCHATRTLANYQLGRVDNVRAAMADLDRVLAVVPEPIRQAAGVVVLCVASALVSPELRRERLRAVRELAEVIDSPVFDGWTGFLGALASLYEGDAGSAVAELERALAIARETGNVRLEGNLQGLRLVAFTALDDAELSAAYARTLQELRAANDWSTIWWALEALAEHWARTGALRPAAVLLGHLEARGQNSSRAFADRPGALTLVEAEHDSPSLMAQGASLNRESMLAFTMEELATPRAPFE